LTDPCSEKYIDEEFLPDAKHPPQVSCHSYVIVEAKRCMPYFTKHHNEIRQMASLTKIMTCYVAVKLAQDLNLILKTTWFPVSSFACSVGGTTAHLEIGQRVCVYDLLIGLMLPSGNDASIALAEGFH